MTEAFVTLETEKMLKEKGFMEDCMAFYTKNVLFKCNAYINTNVLKLPAPTQSIAQKWLRETKNIHIYAYITVLVAMDTKYLKLIMELI